jgi:2-polyprenyl-3-methyl-5-hydroxy-6-metoxy-1,4-benzoquinol methylase
VLDVGAAGGFLRHHLPPSEYYLMGVDMDADYVRQAGELYDEVYQADIATDVSFPLQQQPLTIVLADILEHLVDPGRVLSALLQAYATSQAQIIVSLPNFAHLYVRLNLLVGHFEYAERGILDKTHLRFFTLDTARRLLTSSGLETRSIHTTPIPLPLVSQRFAEGQVLHPLHTANALLSRLFRTLLAYQFIFEAYYV